MCGFAGLIDRTENRQPKPLGVIAEDMAATLIHRGPDDDGAWADADAGVALGFRRLSVIDLSETGHQPMVSADGRWVMVYNGEVYNHAELRRELEEKGTRFRGRSDTEVVLEACALWGVEAAARSFMGMFAFALWDRSKRMLYLVRDRLGVKPIYWAQFGRLFLFGSELKALRAHPGWTPKIDKDTAAAFFRHTYCPAPYTIYQGVHKLMPGHILTYAVDDALLQVSPYWSVANAAAAGMADPLAISEEDAADELDVLLRDAVRRRMVADVPVGAFLSGGIDSSMVAAAMQATGTQPAKTFSIGFTEAAFNEAPFAKQVAEHLATDHCEHYLTPDAACDVIPDLQKWYDEPFADSSQIPTILVSRLTREKVTVALTGDGGDELFGGYERYFYGEKAWRQVEAIPAPLRVAVAGAVKVLPARAINVMLNRLPGWLRPGAGGEALHWYADFMSSGGQEGAYRQMVSIWPNPRQVIPSSREHRGDFWGTAPPAVTENFFDHMQYLDTGTYLPDDILVKVDRASMAFGLETRSPFLDHRLLEFSWRLPRRLKTRNGSGKWLLRRVLNRYVPPSMTDRPKMGFGVPIGKWLKGPLRDWSEELLSAKRLQESGLIDPAPVRECWQQHVDGSSGWDARLWTVLMFQSWRQHWMG